MLTGYSNFSPYKQLNFDIVSKTDAFANASKLTNAALSGSG